MKVAGWLAPQILLAAALCACASGQGSPTAPGEAAASCIGPHLTTAAHEDPAVRGVITVSAGQTLRIHGYGYQTCHDTNHQPAARPYRHLTIFMVQGGSRMAVATVSARLPDGSFTAIVRIPTTAHPGPATMRTSLNALEMPLRLRIGSGR